MQPSPAVAQHQSERRLHHFRGTVNESLLFDESREHVTLFQTHLHAAGQDNRDFFQPRRPHGIHAGFHEHLRTPMQRFERVAIGAGKRVLRAMQHRAQFFLIHLLEQPAATAEEPLPRLRVVERHVQPLGPKQRRTRLPLLRDNPDPRNRVAMPDDERPHFLVAHRVNAAGVAAVAVLKPGRHRHFELL